LDIAENKNISIKKVFTKLDLQWSYNNVWIKKSNNGKIIFITLEGSFEPTVILFSLTNSSAILQTMINKILWDLINTRNIKILSLAQVATQAKT